MNTTIAAVWNPMTDQRGLSKSNHHIVITVTVEVSDTLHLKAFKSSAVGFFGMRNRHICRRARKRTQRKTIQRRRTLTIGIYTVPAVVWMSWVHVWVGIITIRLYCEWNPLINRRTRDDVTCWCTPTITIQVF